METCSKMSNWTESSALTTVHLLSGSLAPALSTLTSPSPCCHIKVNTKHLSVPEAAQEFPVVQEHEQRKGYCWGRELEQVRERAKSPAVAASAATWKGSKGSNSPFLKTFPAHQEPNEPRFPPSRPTTGAATNTAFQGSSHNEQRTKALPFWQPAMIGNWLWLEPQR